MANILISSLTLLRENLYRNKLFEKKKKSKENSVEAVTKFILGS